MMQFEQVPSLPAHHLHGATLQDGPRLWTVAAFGGERAHHDAIAAASEAELYDYDINTGWPA